MSTNRFSTRLLTISLIILFAGGLPLHLFTQSRASATIQFYGTKMKLDRLPAFQLNQADLRHPMEINQYLTEIPASSLDRLHEVLNEKQDKYALNDWLRYRLTVSLLEQAYNQLGPDQQQVLLLLLLAKAGFDSRIMINQRGLETVFYIEDQVFSAYTMSFEEGEKSYLVPSTINQTKTPDRKGFYSPFAPNPNGRPLNLGLMDWPKLKGAATTITYRFQVGEERFQQSLEVENAQSVRSFLEDYPVLEAKAYWRAPIAKDLLSQLDNWILPILKNRPVQDQVKVLLAFCRQAFTYKTDDDAYGRERPFFAQELFLSPYSDCEDRVALFFQLVTRWLELPIVVVDMPDHLTTAVAFPGGEGDFLELNGKKFWFCDPTGPANPGGEIWLAPPYENEKMALIDKEFFSNN